MVYPLMFSSFACWIYCSCLSAFSDDLASIYKNLLMVDIIKLLNLLTLFSNLLYSCYIWKKYPIMDDLGNFLYPAEFWLDLDHNLNLPFVILTNFVFIIVLLGVWYTRINFIFFLSLLQLLMIFLVLAFSCTSMFMFLLFFELASVPIFILMVHQGSLSRERVKASYYFLIFTVYGSISMLLFLVNSYNMAMFTESFWTDSASWLLLFIAFCVKAPLFPFHTWLPFAHVEASTAVSMMLAAMMLKLGGYGIMKFMLPLFSWEVHLFFKPFAVFLCIVSVMYGGYCALRQIDLKSQMAFSSIAHMGFALLGVFSYTEIGMKGGVYLMVSHGLTSSALFFLIGVLSDSYHTRSVLAFSGLFTVMPVFSFFLLMFSLANMGFPGTSGFLPEFFMLLAILKSIPLMLFFVLFGMFVVTAGGLLVLLRVLFGHPKGFFVKNSWVDILYHEFFVLILLLFWTIYFGFFDFFAVNIEHLAWLRVVALWFN